MPSLIAEDDFDPQRITSEFVERCKAAREWHIKCYVQEEWFINGVVPFTISMKDGLYTCKVIAPTKEEAIRKVEEYMPVIKFVEDNGK